MRAREFLFDNQNPSVDNLESLKATIVHKITELPDDKQTQHSLEEIEEVLSSIEVGGRKKSTLSNFATWSDKDVRDAKDLLAKYVLSLGASPSEKNSMLTQWREGGLIDLDILLDGNKNSIERIVKGYSTNSAVTELANDLVQVSSLGKGKGEFMLKVLCPNINEPKSGKGDIEVTGFGTVEVKTTDGGAGRFTDRQVKPGSGFQQAVNSFMKTFKPFLETEQAPAPVQQPVQSQFMQPPAQQAQQQEPVPQEEPMSEATKRVAKPKKLSSKTGLNIDQLTNLYQLLPQENKQDFVNKLTHVFDEIFVKVPQYSGAVITSITSGNSAKAKQLYGVACLNNYMAHKSDKGILYISLAGETSFTFFTDNESLNNAGMRLNIGTAYPVSLDMQMVYPQTTIVNTAQEQPSL